MASIIRSPELSQERRKLTTRRARNSAAHVEKEAAAAAPIAPPVAEEAPAPAPVQTKLAKRTGEADVAALVEQARQSVLEQFKAEGEKARELGRQRGLVEGRQTGVEESRKTFESELDRVRSIADKLQDAMASNLKGIEDIAVSIAFEAVCKILGEAAVTREGVQALVRQAATHATNTEKVVVRLHPADLAALRDTGALDTSLASGVAASWVADEAIALGGCVLETDSGELDARLETQVARLRATLLAARGNKSGL